MNAASRRALTAVARGQAPAHLYLRGATLLNVYTGELYAANVWLRTASRLLVRIARFRAASFRDLERGLAAVDWSPWLAEESGVEVEEAQVAQRPKSTVPLDEDGAVKLMRLIDALEDQDDVDAVHANFDVDAEVLERVAG